MKQCDLFNYIANKQLTFLALGCPSSSCQNCFYRYWAYCLDSLDSKSNRQSNGHSICEYDSIFFAFCIRRTLWFRKTLCWALELFRGSAGAGVTKVIFGHGVTKTHRKNFQKKTKNFFPKNLYFRQFWLFFSKTRAPHPAEIL